VRLRPKAANIPGGPGKGCGSNYRILTLALDQFLGLMSTPKANSQTVDLRGKINVPINEKTTITVKPDSTHPDGVKITVTTHKTHQDYFVEFIQRLFSLFRRR
jgi:hypothetical protein